MAGEDYVAINLTKGYRGTAETRSALWERSCYFDQLRTLRQGVGLYVSPRNLPKIQRNGS